MSGSIGSGAGQRVAAPPQRQRRRLSQLGAARVMAVLAAVVAAAVGPAPLAHADPSTVFEVFQSPSGMIACQLLLDPVQSTDPWVSCDIRDHSWVNPPRAASCEHHWGDGVSLQRGRPATMDCRGDWLFGDNPVLPYGATKTFFGITCDSEPTGMACRDDTGHFFSLSRDSYQLG
jgi:hypothetical protein